MRGNHYENIENNEPYGYDERYEYAGTFSDVRWDV